jgi:hypothetical protein
VAFRSLVPLAGAAAFALAVSAGRASAQSSLYDADLLRDLPGSRDVFSLLETSEPLTMADRWDGGGLYTGEAGRLSARGASWTQTVFQLDGLDVSDPLAGGRPLVLPWHEALDAMDFAIGGARREPAGPGPLVALTSVRPQDAWKGSLALDGRLGGSGEPVPPSVARLDHWRRGALTAAGPLNDRLGLLVSGQTASSARFVRGSAEADPSSVHALMAGLTWKAGDRDHLRVKALGQKTAIPYTDRSAFGEAGLEEDDRTFHAAATWERRADSGASWTLSGGALRARADGEAGTRPRTIERLLDGPAALLAVPGQAERSRVELAGTLSPAPIGSHALHAGLRLSRGAAVVRPSVPAWTVAERVDGVPARVWEFEQGASWRPHIDELTVHVSDAWQAGTRLRVDATLPLHHARAAGLSWTSVAPRVGVRAQPFGSFTAFASWSRDVHRLPLALFAFGDPDALRAASYRWNDRDGDGAFVPSERGVLVSRAGPGAPIGSIDPSLPRPRTDEWRAGLEASLGTHVRARLEGIARKSRGLWESVNTGVTVSSYDQRLIFDPSGDIVGSADDQLLPIYDRRPASFGRDALLLTSVPDDDSLYEGVELQLLAGPPRARLWLSATAHRAVGAGGNRSFRPSENDQGLVGERFDDPNANTFDRGRLFSDRAYTIKIAGAWHAPGDVRLGTVARYQDGQPFARVVVVPDLRQGADFVMAIPRGRARYTFAITWDVRVEKVFTLGRSQASAVLEVFNLLDNVNETEEDIVTGPAYRTPTFLQPPRTFRGGLRIAF